MHSPLKYNIQLLDAKVVEHQSIWPQDSWFYFLSGEKRVTAQVFYLAGVAIQLQNIVPKRSGLKLQAFIFLLQICKLPAPWQDS